MTRQIEGRCVVKSGTDFRQFGHITMHLSGDITEKPRIDVHMVDVTTDFAEDLDLKEALDKYSSKSRIGATRKPCRLNLFTLQSRRWRENGGGVGYVQRPLGWPLLNSAHIREQSRQFCL